MINPLLNKLKIEIMHPTEDKIKIASKLYECRDSVKSLCKMSGKDYKEDLAPFTHILKETMKSNNLKPIPALLLIAKTDMYNNSGMAQLYFMTAVVEILEPS